MSYADKIFDIIDKTKKDAETALKQSSASSASSLSLPDPKNYSSYESYRKDYHAAKTGRTESEKEDDGVILPNPRNYDSFSDYRTDYHLAKTGKKVFKSGAYNHGVDAEYLTSLWDDVESFMKSQDEKLKTNPFGDTTAADEADSAINTFRERLANVEKFRLENAKWLEKKQIGNFRSPLEAMREATALKQYNEDGTPIVDFSRDMNAVQGVEKDDELADTDAYIKLINDKLDAVQKEWNNRKVTYIHYGNDEKAYNDALMRGRHEYETYAEVKAALANPGRVSRMSAEELEYLTNYGLRHGYSDPAEYDKEIAELMVEKNRLEELVSNAVKEVDVGYQLLLSKNNELVKVESKIASLEAARDALAESQAAWSSYTPFFNAEDFDYQSKYRGDGNALTQIINAEGVNEQNALLIEDNANWHYFIDYGAGSYDSEERAMYNYLYNTQGEEAALVFAESIAPLVKRRQHNENLQKQAEWARENPILGTGVSFLTNVGSAVLAPGQLIANIVGAEDTAQKLGLLADVTGSLRGGASEYFEEDLGLGVVGKIGYGAVTSAVDMLIARKLAGLTAGAAGQKLSSGITQAIMSSEAASATMADANRRGLNRWQVAALGVTSAAIEYLSEKHSIDALMSKPKTALGYWAKNVIAEGSEEAVAEIAGDIVDQVIAGNKSETMMRYHELVASGMDPKEASREVLLDNLKDVGLAAITGAAAGGMQAGPAAIGYASDTRRAERRAGGVVRRTDDAQFIINEGLKAAPGTELHKLAEKAQAELKKKGKVSDGTIGKIVMEGGEAISNAYAQHNENKKYFRDSDNIEADTENGAVESAENVSEAFEGAEVREAVEREKAPIIDNDGIVAGSARATKTTERRRVDISTLSKDAQVRARGVESVAKLFGKSVNFYESDAGDNGYYNRIDNSINVNVYAKNPYTVVFGHELTHGTEAAEKLYTQLKTAVERFKDKEYGAGTFSKEALTLQESRARKGKEFAVSYEGAKREVVANFISEKLFTDEATVKKFIRENRSVGQRIYEAVRAMLRKVTKGKAGYGTLKDIEHIYAKALRETAKLDKARSEMIRSTEEKQQTVKEIARELGEKLRTGEITEEEYDRLFDERVASTPEFRGEVAAEARGVMGFTDSSAEGAVNQEKRFSVEDEEIKSEQLHIIEETNPAPNTYSTWIRTAEDIKTLAETLEDSDWVDVDTFNPDLTRDDILKAIESGKIKIYSSYPIENGVFVSPSYMEAESYSGDGQVYAKNADIRNVAWIDPTQGQYAEIFDPNTGERIQFSVAGDEDSESLARAVEAQGRELLDSYIDTEAPPEVKQEYTENNVNYPTTDYLRGRFVGYDTAADAIKALAQGRLSNKKALELAELLNMPEVANEKGEVSPIIPFRTYFIINSLGTYKRRDTGAEVPVVGYALPAADENGVWLHYYNGETKDYTNQYYTFDELTRTKAQHVATRAEWDAYLEFIEEGGKASVPSELAPTQEDLAEWRVSDNAFTVITPEQMNAAQGIYERMKPKERNYVDRTMRNFRAEVAKIFSIPKLYSDLSNLMSVGDEAAADFFNNGTFGPSMIEKTFEKAHSKASELNEAFLKNYGSILDGFNSTKLLISEEDANELAGGLDAFKKKARGLIPSVSYRRDGRSGTTVDSYYGELSGSHPELFPSDIVHPAAQLNRMLNVAREISKAKSFVEAPTEESKAAMLNEYMAAIGTLGHPLSNAIKQSVESELLSAVAGDAFRSEAEEILELGTKLPGMIREIKKLQYKLLLSDHDVRVVGDLLAGYVTEDAVRKAEFNADEIIRMYEAQKPYREATKRMQEYRARVNDNNRAIAEKVMGDIMKWDSNKKFANIMFNFMDFPRIIREIAPDEKTAELFIKTYIDPLRRESADRVRYVNEIRERVKKMGLSREIREGDKISESAAVQLLGEARAAQAMLEERMNKNKASTKQYERDGQTLDEWRRDEEALWEANPSFKDPTVRKRIENAAKEFREIYDKLHGDLNRTLVDNALSPVQYRAGYFPHFEKEIDNKFITRVLSFMGFAKEVQVLPTEIAGRTGDFRPNRQWFGNAMQRAVNNREQQKETVLFDAVEGLDRYIEAASSLIFHTTSISRFRALERYIRTATADGELKTQIERIEQSTTLSEDEKNSAIADQTRNRPFALSAFAQFLLEYTNKLAGKQSIIDRGVENLFGREVFNISKAITKKYAVNATSSLSSALTNFLPLAQGSGGYRFWDLAGAVWDIMRNADVGDESDFVVSREGTDRLVKTGVEKWGDRARRLFENIDSFVTRATVQARYRYNLSRRIDNEAALYEADSWARALIGDRSTGMQPLFFESNNPFIKVFSQFQLEVNNQFLRLIRDTPGEFKGRMKLYDNKAIGITDAVYHFSKAAFFTWLLNGAFEKLVGRGPGGDVLGIIFDAIAAGTGFDLFEWMFQWVPGIDEDEDDEGDGFFAGVGELFAGTAEELPFLGSVLGGGRVPIASALPDVKKLYNAFTDEDASWQYKTGTAFSELSTPLLYMVMPFGASQVKKTGQFVNDLVHGGAYAYDKEGNPKLKYPVEGLADIARGLLFGSTATTGGKEWIDSGFNTLSADQTKAYEGVVDTGVDKYTALEAVDDMRRLKPAEGAKSVTKDQKIEYLEGIELDDEAKAAIYTYIVAGKDSSEQKLLLRADELGVTPGVIYRQLVGFEKIAADHKESGEDGAVADKIEQLANATVLDAAKAEIYVSVVSSDKYKDLIAAGASEKDAAVTAWEVAKLLPAGEKKNVVEAQKVSVALRQGLSETEAAVFLEKGTREKLDALAEYGVTVKGYAAVKEYLLYNDEKSATMDDVRRAINKVSNGSAVSEPGMPDVALNLSRDEKAALWQMWNSSWNPEKNPFSVSVGRKVQKALKALDGDEE